MEENTHTQAKESDVAIDEGLGIQVGIVLAHRYLYYVMNQSVISDYEYDMLEKKAIAEKAKGYTKLLVPGSTFKEDYPFITSYTALMILKVHENKTNAPLIPS